MMNFIFLPELQWLQVEDWKVKSHLFYFSHTPASPTLVTNSLALVKNLEGSSAYRRASPRPPGGERDCFAMSSMIALLPLLIFWNEMGRRLSPTVPAMLMYIFNPPKMAVTPLRQLGSSRQSVVSVTALLSGERCGIPARNRLRYCMYILSGGMTVYVFFYFFFFLFSSFYLFIYLSASKDGTSRSERRPCGAGGESILLPLLSLLLMYFCSE